MRFSVIGRPIPQGSKTLMRGIMVDQQNIKTKTLPANRLKSWRESVAYTAAFNFISPTLGKVMIDVVFYFCRPASHKTKSGGVRRSKVDAIPPYDLDKLQRAIGDALSGVVYKDDKQVVHWQAAKQWTLGVSKAEIIVGVL